MDGYLHGSCNHRHGELSARMATGMDIVIYCYIPSGHQHGGLLAWMAIFTVPVTISTADYWHRWLPAWILLYIVIFLQDTSTDDYWHGWLSSRMTTFMAPVTIGIDDYLHGSCNHQHGELSARMATGTDIVIYCYIPSGHQHG